MEIITNIKNAVNGFIASSIQNTEENHKREMEAKEARLAKQITIAGDSILQVKEFNGALFLSYDGIPVVRTDMLKKDITEVLKNSRADYLAFMLKEYKK